MLFEWKLHTPLTHITGTGPHSTMDLQHDSKEQGVFINDHNHGYTVYRVCLALRTLNSPGAGSSSSSSQRGTAAHLVTWTGHTHQPCPHLPLAWWQCQVTGVPKAWITLNMHPGRGKTQYLPHLSGRGSNKGVPLCHQLAM